MNIAQNREYTNNIPELSDEMKESLIKDMEKLYFRESQKLLKNLKELFYYNVKK